MDELQLLRAALTNINSMACYASEEDIDSREAMLLRIGEVARAALDNKTEEFYSPAAEELLLQRARKQREPQS